MHHSAKHRVSQCAMVNEVFAHGQRWRADFTRSRAWHTEGQVISTGAEKSHIACNAPGVSTPGVCGVVA
jgi:hypothetical protein